MYNIREAPPLQTDETTKPVPTFIQCCLSIKPLIKDVKQSGGTPLVALERLMLTLIIIENIVCSEERSPVPRPIGRMTVCGGANVHWCPVSITLRCSHWSKHHTVLTQPWAVRPREGETWEWGIVPGRSVIS